MKNKRPEDLIKQDLLSMAVEHTLEHWVDNGEHETTLSVTLRTDATVEIRLIGDRVIFPLLLSELIEHAGKDETVSQGRFLYLINGLLRLKGIEPDGSMPCENGLTIKFKEAVDDDNL